MARWLTIPLVLAASATFLNLFLLQRRQCNTYNTACAFSRLYKDEEKGMAQYVITSRIMLQNRDIGTVSRICPRVGSNLTLLTPSACWLMEHWSRCNNNGPMPLYSRPWMNPSLRHGIFLLYSSSHESDVGEDIRIIMATEEQVPGNQLM